MDGILQLNTKLRHNIKYKLNLTRQEFCVLVQILEIKFLLNNFFFFDKHKNGIVCQIAENDYSIYRKKKLLIS